MIQIYRLTMRFPNGIEALRDVSFRVHEGELAFIAGRSGSGKSTLLSLITAELKASDGQILVAGRNLSVLKADQRPFLRRTIGRLWQDPRLLPDRTVRENVSIPLEILGVTGERARHRIDQVIEPTASGPTGRNPNYADVMRTVPATLLLRARKQGN